MERCPLCRALLNGADTCRRCRTELGTAQRVEREARILVGAAIDHLMRGDTTTATLLLRRAMVRHATPEARFLWRVVAAAPQPAEPDNRTV